ncbi:hypothetical protein GOP47_0022320 [Adiantum capillus-veneris]|uniref:Uncharacterized protein n=1 Tax=Adiantum capillus-veneris TaxID=13818 RepID=A0A9D4Z629_ADICA|nr:hypothetical protein GOP47_0022320 [Adiantum capillus-veneris]
MPLVLKRSRSYQPWISLPAMQMTKPVRTGALTRQVETLQLCEDWRCERRKVCRDSTLVLGWHTSEVVEHVFVTDVLVVKLCAQQCWAEECFVVIKISKTVFLFESIT